MKSVKKFEDLGLSEKTLKALLKKGFEEPTLIQERTIPLLLEDQVDIIGQAQTGTGKTAAFGLPLIDLLSTKSNKVQALVLTPTRELAIQVAEEINSLKGKKKLRIVPIYGGQSIELQLRRLREGVQIVVGTPGRIIDHLNRRTLKLDNLSHLILDEADEMLNMGFIEDVERILKDAPDDRRMLLFSATMPKAIQRLARKYMPKYELVQVKAQQLTTELTEQIYFEVSMRDRLEALSRIVDIETDFYGLVFCRTKVEVDRLTGQLNDRGYAAHGIHGDVSQFQRELILKKFKKKQARILVATDVAARGIDIQDLTHVINYSLPQDPESYVHRIGRTGRAGKQGIAITFITSSEYRKLVFIQKVAKTEIRKESVPDVKDIIQTKKDRIVNDVQQNIETDRLETYQEFSAKLLEQGSPEKVVASLLKMAFKTELDSRNYSQIREVSVDRSGTTRLFVALGKEQDMTPGKMKEYIENKTDVSGQVIRDIRVFERFTFISVPFVEAEIILEYFKRHKRGKRPLVVKAKPKGKK